MCAALVSFPLDTVKTQIQIEMIQNQTTGHRPNTLSILHQLITKDGIRNMYKGVLMPFIGYGVASSMVFGVNNIAKTFVLRRKSRAKPNSKSRRLTLLEISLCGGFTGFLNTFLVTPIERVKVWSQSHHWYDQIQTLHRHFL